MQGAVCMDVPSIDHRTVLKSPACHPNALSIPAFPHAAYGRAIHLGRHTMQTYLLALALLSLGTYLFCFSVVGFPTAVTKDFENSNYDVDDERVWRYVYLCVGVCAGDGWMAVGGEERCDGRVRVSTSSMN